MEVPALLTTSTNAGKFNFLSFSASERALLSVVKLPVWTTQAARSSAASGALVCVSFCGLIDGKADLAFGLDRDAFATSGFFDAFSAGFAGNAFGFVLGPATG